MGYTLIQRKAMLQYLGIQFQMMFKIVFDADPDHVMMRLSEMHQTQEAAHIRNHLIDSTWSK